VASTGACVHRLHAYHLAANFIAAARPMPDDTGNDNYF